MKLDNEKRNGKFTQEEYASMIEKLKENSYIFAEFTEAEELLEKNIPFVLMRHDVDMDLQLALEIAKIEAKLNVSSTFFFLLRTDHYNLFSDQGTNIVKQILDLGHHLGLHFDNAAYPDMEVSKLAKACSKEAEVLENWFSKPINIVSYHRPSEIVLQGSPKLSAPRKHTYMPLYTRNIKYCSDSTGNWRHGSPEDLEEFKQKKPLQILTHPIWWNVDSIPAYDTLKNLVVRKNEQFEDSLAQNCKVFRQDKE